ALPPRHWEETQDRPGSDAWDADTSSALPLAPGRDIRPYLYSFLYKPMRLIPSSAAARRRLLRLRASASMMRCTSTSIRLSLSVRGASGTAARCGAGAETTQTVWED